MIYSDKQYSVSKAQIATLREALLAARNRALDPQIREIEIRGIEDQIADIERELAEYDLLKSGSISFSKTYALGELPRVLVQARIASGMSQTDLAEKLKLKPQQIQRYEATNYMGASLSRLIEVSRVLGVKTSESFQVSQKIAGSVFVWRDIDDIVWREIPYKEMIKRKWFNVPRGANPIDKVKEYFYQAAGPEFATALHRKKMHSGNAPNEHALLAWQARILERAHAKIRTDTIKSFKPDESWLPALAQLTRQQDGPARARDLLAQKGVILITERQLPGTYLDGAAMLAIGGSPVIALTLRYDRLDNFWFVLMHELAHVFLHLLGGLRFDFFDEEGASDVDGIEEEADKFALDHLIPENLWDQCLSRFALSEEAVRIDAETLGIDPSIIAGRIRKELKNYTILNDLVGQGQVRSQFEEESDDLD